MDHRTRVLGAAEKALSTLFAPPSVLAVEKRHGLDVLERATTLAADTEMRGKVREGVGKTLVHYLRADKIPGAVPLTFAQFVARWGDKSPDWLAPYLVGVVGVEPESWTAKPKERTTVIEHRDEDVDEGDERPQPCSRVTPRESSEPALLTARGLIPQRRAT